jgi:UDP-glucose 4-epimerase
VAEAVTGKAIAVKEAPRRSGDPAELVAAADAIRHEFGWMPNYVSLQAIIASAWRWHSAHPKGFDY